MGGGGGEVVVGAEELVAGIADAKEGRRIADAEEVQAVLVGADGQA